MPEWQAVITPAFARSQYFGCERDDFHKALGAQFARDRAENAGADRLELVVKQDRRIAVELDGRTVRPAQSTGSANDHRAVYLALFYPPARGAIFDRHFDDLPDLA